MIKTRGYAAYDAKTPLRDFDFARREPQANDVHIEILYCGVCHSDLHQARDEWSGSSFPLVPGHEIIGRVIAKGDAVVRFNNGDLVGVGCLVDSCGSCSECSQNQEQYCDQPVFTYNSYDRHSGGLTYGGYSSQIVVDQRFVLKISEQLNAAAAAPLLCAGITTWSPLRHWKVGKGHKVGIVGLGGLGHMGVKFAHALGAEVVLFTTSPGKVADAQRLGADQAVISKNADEMNRHTGSFDLILDTVAAPHNLDAYLTLLKRDGTLCLLGVPDSPHPAPNVANLIFRRRNLSGSLIGGLRETQEMLDYCAKYNIVSDIEQIPIQQINLAYDRMLRGDVKYRFVIDLSSLKE